MVAINAETSTPPPGVETSPEQTTVGQAFAQDTLTKADRLDIAYVRRDAAVVEPAMLVAKSPDETPPPSLGPATPPKIVSRHWHDPNARKSAAVSPGRRIKDQEPKRGTNVDRRKATVDLRTCRRPEGFAGLLKALNLAPGCDT
jgi:hypothetical protein